MKSLINIHVAYSGVCLKRILSKEDTLLEVFLLSKGQLSNNMKQRQNCLAVSKFYASFTLEAHQTK